jgi:hypothetical protein
MLNLASYRNSPVRSTKSTPSDINVLRLFVSARFQVLFHSPSGVLFTFPSRYYSLSVAGQYLALESGLPNFTRGFSCPVLLTNRLRLLLPFAYETFTPYGCTFQYIRLDRRNPVSFRSHSCLSYNPGATTPAGLALHRFRLFPVRSPLLRESLLISLPRGTEMFQFPRFPSLTYGFS